MKEQKRSKMIYERPRIVELDGSVARGSGANCVSGTNAQQTCDTGTSARTCAAGSGVGV